MAMILGALGRVGGVVACAVDQTPSGLDGFEGERRAACSACKE